MADFDWSGLIGTGAGIAANMYAAKQNKKAIEQAVQPQQQVAQQVTQAQQPYSDVGARAASLLNNEDITRLPGYQTGLDAGLGSIDRRAAAAGGFNSGNRDKARIKYATDYNAGKTAERQGLLTSLLGVGQNSNNAIYNANSGAANATGYGAVANANTKQNSLASALDLATKYLTTKNANGQTNGGSIYDSVKSWASPSSSRRWNTDSSGEMT